MNQPGFVTDAVHPVGDAGLGFLGNPLPAPFQGEVVEILRGEHRMFPAAEVAESTVIDGAHPLAGDATSMAEPMTEAAEAFRTDDPAQMPHPDLTPATTPDEYAARVQKCWPQAMAYFNRLMQETIDG